MTSKLQAGIIKPAKFADGTGPGVVGDAPQLKYIDPNATQVQYHAPDQMSLDDAHKAIQGLYGPGQDYSDALAQIQALQGQIHPQRWSDHLIDFGSRLMGGGNFGQAVQGAMADDRNIGQQNLTNIMALMRAKQAIQADQQRRADQIAGQSTGYAQTQNQDAINAAKNQYDVDRNNVSGRISAEEHNNGITQEQQNLDLQRNQAMANEGQVAAMQRAYQEQANAETDPAKKAALQQKANAMGEQLKQVQALAQADLDRKAAEQMKVQNNASANALKLQKEIASQYSSMNGGLSSNSPTTQLTSDPIGRLATDYLLTGSLPKLGSGKTGTDAAYAVNSRAAMIANRYGISPDVMPAIRTAYKANSGAINNLTKQTATVDAFEGTAGKNLDMLTNLSKGIVQAGSPLLNKPLRSIDVSALPAEQQNLVNAAREVALNEVAKITSSANAGSGVLSDAARTEAQKFVPSSATLGATIKLAALLKQDMKNRHDAYHGQLSKLYQHMADIGGPGVVRMLQDIHPNRLAEEAYRPEPDAFTVDSNGKPQLAGNKPSIQVGQTVRLKNGTTGKIKAVYPDGRFDLE